MTATTTATTTAVTHAVAYLLPGLGLSAIAVSLWTAARGRVRSPAAPRWARWYARLTVALLLLAGAGLLAVGIALAAVVLSGVGG